MNVLSKCNFLLRGEHVSAGEMIIVSDEQAAELWGWRIYPKEFPENNPTRDLRPLPPKPPTPPSNCPWERMEDGSRRWPRYDKGAFSFWIPPFKHTLPKGSALREVLDKLDQIRERRKIYKGQQREAEKSRIKNAALWAHVHPLPPDAEERCRRRYSPPPFVIEHRPKIIYSDDLYPQHIY